MPLAHALHPPERLLASKWHPSWRSQYKPKTRSNCSPKNWPWARCQAKAEVQLALPNCISWRATGRRCWPCPIPLMRHAPRTGLASRRHDGHSLDSLPYRAYLRAARAFNQSEVLNEMTHLHTMLGASKRDKEALVLAQARDEHLRPCGGPRRMDHGATPNRGVCRTSGTAPGGTSCLPRSRAHRGQTR